jgi:hypothetical protein
MTEISPRHLGLANECYGRTHVARCKRRDELLAPYDLEVRHDGWSRWALFRGDEKLTPWGSQRTAWNRAVEMHPELPWIPSRESRRARERRLAIAAGQFSPPRDSDRPSTRSGVEALDDDARRAAKRLLMLAEGDNGARADVAILLAKKMAPVTRLLAMMRRRPKTAEWRLANAMQRLIDAAPDAAFEYAIREARKRRFRERRAST